MKLMNQKKAVYIAIVLVVMILSVFVFSKMASDPQNHATTIESLDDKKATVLKLTAASTAAATAIAAVPGDATTPIANKLADLTSYFVIILMMIFLEKYLVTLVGYVAFTWVIPIACGVFILGLCLNKHAIQIIGAKLAVFGLVLFFIIPMSMKVSNMIDENYSASVETTLQAVQETTDTVDENTDSEGNIIDKLLSKAETGITDLKDKGEQLLNDFIESIAVMLVTSCVIPILVFFLAIWLVKLLFGVEINVPTNLPKRLTKHKSSKSIE